MTERRRPRSIARVGSASGDATPTKDHQPHGDHQEIEQERRQGRGAGGGVVPAVFGAKETATAPVGPSFESTCSLPAADFAMKPECTLTGADSVGADEAVLTGATYSSATAEVRRQRWT